MVIARGNEGTHTGEVGVAVNGHPEGPCVGTVTETGGHTPYIS